VSAQDVVDTLLFVITRPRQSSFTTYSSSLSSPADQPEPRFSMERIAHGQWSAMQASQLEPLGTSPTACLPLSGLRTK
jgi:hypothetical protein